MITTSPERPACPKCGHARAPGGKACARCGLVFALWTPDKAAVALVPLDPRGDELWAGLAADWRNIARHDAFAKHCSLVGTLAAAGRCYRERLDAAPDDAVAQQMQARIVSMAMVQLPARAAQPPEPVTRSKWFWGVMFLVGVAGILGGLIFGR